MSVARVGGELEPRLAGTWEPVRLNGLRACGAVVVELMGYGSEVRDDLYIGEFIQAAEVGGAGG